MLERSWEAHTLYVRVGLQARQVGRRRTGRRKSIMLCHTTPVLPAWRTYKRYRGYAALAVATEQGTHTKEIETGMGENREDNMVAFSVEALILLRDVMRGDAKL